MVNFPTRLNAILDLVLSENPGSTQALPNLNISDHVVVLLTLPSFTNVIIPADRRVYHWSRAPWGRLRHYFSSFHWKIPKSVDAAVSFITNVIVLATQKFVPSCAPRLSRPTPWWNHDCETAWRQKMKCWKSGDSVRFCRVSLRATSIYLTATRKYQANLRKKLGNCTGSKQWWSLLSSLAGCSYRGLPAVPPAHQLASYFSSKLSCSSTFNEPPTLEECHHSTFRQFRIKKSQVKSVLLSLDVAKSVGDDGVSPRILNSCAQSLCGPLTTLFRMICRHSDFPTSWKISRVTPVFKKGSRTDPTCYRPITVLPALSRVFEKLLVTQLRRHIDLHIPREQFGFMRGSSTSDAGVLLASTITTAINQRAEARLVALDIKGAFDSVWWRGLLAHLWSIGLRDKVFQLFESYLSNRFIRIVTPLESSDLYPVTAGVPQGAIWSPTLFNLYIRLLPTVVKHSLIVGYADDHTLLKIIPDKSDRVTAASQLNEDLEAISQFGKIWQITFAPSKTFSLLISLKRDLLPNPHPPLTMDGTIIPESNSIKVLGFKFDSLLT